MMLDMLISGLKTDKDLYYSWQANIAVQFQDEFARSEKKYKNRQDIHAISNEAAKNFLNLLISGRE